MQPDTSATAALMKGDRRQRALELRAHGKKVVGYFCCFPPIEMMTALDLVPFRIQGDINRSISAADAYLETICCSYVRSCFDLALDGYYDFLDGLIVPHSCDTVQRIYDIWRRYRRPQVAHFLNVPHMIQPAAFVFFKEELRRLQKALEGLAGKDLSIENLRQAITRHNEVRALQRALYDLRKCDPPAVSGVDVHNLILAGLGLPAGEYRSLLEAAIAEGQARPRRGERRPRVLVAGSELDDATFIELVEQSGADVVVDDVCTGTRSFWPDVAVTDDPYDGLAARYLGEINCPRTYRNQQQSRAADLDSRFGYLGRFARDFRVNGVIVNIIRFCDTHELEVPDIVEYFATLGIRVLHLEEEYRIANFGQIKTRVQAFVETLGGLQ